LNRLIAKENRRILGEAAVTFMVGLGTSVVVYGGVFWLTYLVSWFIGPLRALAPFNVALAVTGLFILISLWSAWRRHDPMHGVEAIDDDQLAIQLGIGYAFGVPVMNRQSVAGASALLVGGPANVMEAARLFRSRIRTDDRQNHQAIETLASLQAGGDTPHPSPPVVAMLYRLGLIKAVRGRDDKMALALTVKGGDLVRGESATQQSTPRPNR